MASSAEIPRILIIDDDAHLLRAASRLLRGADYTVLEATTGRAGLQLAREECPDVILLDVMLPDMDGLHVCRQIKADPGLTDVYVLLVSPYRTTSDERADGLDAGADDYVARPVPNRELLARVRTALRLKRAEQALRERTHQLGQRVKELNCLYGLSQVLARPGLSRDEMLQEVVDLIPLACQRPEVTCARITLDGQQFESQGFGESAWRQASDIIVYGRPAGSVEVFHAEDGLQCDEGHLPGVGRSLLDAIAERLGGMIVRVNAEQALLESEDRYRIVSELTSDSAYAFRVGPEGELALQWLTGAVTQITGYTTDELANRCGWENLVHPDDRSVSMEKLQALLAGRSATVEYRVLCKSGEVRCVRDYARPEWDRELGRTTAIYGAVQDITEQRQAEEQLRIISAAAEQTVDAFAILDLEEVVQYANAAFFERNRLSPDQILGKHWRSFVSSHSSLIEDHPEIQDTVLGRQEIWRGEVSDRTASGELEWRDAAVMPVKDAQGRVTHAVFLSTDITERKRAEATLRASEEAYRELVETVSDVIYALDTEGVVTYASPAVEAVFGYLPSEVIGRRFAEFIASEDLAELQARVQRIVSGEVLDPAQFRAITKLGEVRWVRASSQPVLEGGRVTGLQGVMADVTAYKLAEAQLEEAAAAAERERLARELHDAVTQAVFSASLIAETLPKIWESHPDEARHGLEALRRLTCGALAEMRSLLLELRPGALGEQSMRTLLRQLTDGMMARTNVTVTTDIDGDCTLPSEVRLALYRVAQEALNNVARHADASQASLVLRCTPDRASLRIADDGRGFNLTGAEPHHLGLQIMRERAQTIGATLDIQSEPDHGTELEVTWARTAGDGDAQGGEGTTSE